MKSIPKYPETTEITQELRPLLDPALRTGATGVSEFTFANIYLFRNTHNYRAAILDGGAVVLTGRDRDGSFFMLPKGLPDKTSLDRLFSDFDFMKCATEAQATALVEAGFSVSEDRANFDYLYSRRELSALSGRKFHSKKNLVNIFTSQYVCEGRGLTKERAGDAIEVLESWEKGHVRDAADDYRAAREGIESMDGLGLCGRVYYIENRPVAYAMGEELLPDTFVVHFEKGETEYKGIFQYINQEFASVLPERYTVINREQDLGDDGLRKSKMSYRPAGFVKKYKAWKKG